MAKKQKKQKQQKQMKHKQKAKPKRKLGKKSFFVVDAPSTGVKIHLYGSSPEEFEGKIVNLDLTKNLRGKSLILRMRVKVEGENLSAESVSSFLQGSYIRRSMRRGTDYVEDSFEVNCRDHSIRVKPFLITRKKVSRAVRRALRDLSRKFITSYVKIRTAKELFSDIMTNKLQKELSAKLKKVYPLALCDIRSFEVVGKISTKSLSEENIENVSKAGDKTIEVKVGDDGEKKKIKEDGRKKEKKNNKEENKEDNEMKRKKSIEKNITKKKKDNSKENKVNKIVKKVSVKK
jgi:ribosomal protein S3AE